MRKKTGAKMLMTVICIMILSGCAASSGSTYSILDTITPADVQNAAVKGKGLVIAIGPIDVPGYVDSAVAVVESQGNQANISSIDQQAYMLKQELPRVITENLRVLFAPQGASVAPYALDKAADYRIAVNLNKFNITKFDLIETKAQWALYGDKGKTSIMVKDISFTTPMAGKSDVAMKNAMSKALADLTRAIAQAAGPALKGK